MPDTTTLIIGIALAIVVVALIIWLFASARRREAEARRMEAEAMRAKLAERVPVVQEREDRASVTARIAQEARQEAEAAAAEAARLEREAAEHRTTAEAARAEQDELARLADHVDPDVPTDREGFRVDDSGRRLGGSPVASALGMSALAQDDDEPDLADHENPFAAYAAEPTPTESSAQDLPSDDGDAGDPDWVNGPVDEDAADELECHAREDAEAADWINGPEDAGNARDPGPTASSAHSSGVVPAPESSPVSSPDSSVQNLRAEDDPDWVNGPVDEDAADELEAHAHEDAEAADWINGPEDAGDARDPGPTASSAHSSGVVPAPESSAQDLTAEGAESEHSTAEGAAGSAHSTGGVGPSSAQDLPSDEGAPFDPVDEQPSVPARRRVSGLDEVADGGYGVGSAAPIEDGAQPLGHPIMGYHETRTFLVPEAPGYGDTEPDVWFYDEDAARRAGFHAAGEA